MLRYFVAVLTLMGGLAAGPALAEDCPAASISIDDVTTTLGEARSCERAMAIFRACESGSSGDVQLGAIVSGRCEADFLTRLTPPRKLTYRRELQLCDRKYRNQSGTMYRSFEAFCRAGVAQRYSHLALKRT